MERRKNGLLRVEGRTEVAGEKGKSEGSTPAGCRMNRHRTHLAQQSGVRESERERGANQLSKAGALSLIFNPLRLPHSLPQRKWQVSLHPVRNFVRIEYRVAIRISNPFSPFYLAIRSSVVFSVPLQGDAPSPRISLYFQLNLSLLTFLFCIEFFFSFQNYDQQQRSTDSFMTPQLNARCLQYVFDGLRYCVGKSLHSSSTMNRNVSHLPLDDTYHVEDRYERMKFDNN